MPKIWKRASKSRDRENYKRMSTLVMVGYDDPYKAEEVRLKLRKLQSELWSGTVFTLD
jgi:hypothetical protein